MFEKIEEDLSFRIYEKEGFPLKPIPFLCHYENPLVSSCSTRPSSSLTLRRARWPASSTLSQRWDGDDDDADDDDDNDDDDDDDDDDDGDDGQP